MQHPQGPCACYNLWFIGSSPGSIWRLEVLAPGRPNSGTEVTKASKHPLLLGRAAEVLRATMIKQPLLLAHVFGGNS